MTTLSADGACSRSIATDGRKARTNRRHADPGRAACCASRQLLPFSLRSARRHRRRAATPSASGCWPNTVHWTYDTWAYGHGVARAVAQQGVKSVYFITADYAFGHDLEKQFADEFVKQGGKVLGSARHPIGTSDFSSLLLQAQNSGAEVIAFANAGGDTSNSLKQAAEFGLGQRRRLAALIMGQNNVRALGLQASQGILLLVPFYWDMSDASRAFARRFQERHPKRLMPNDMQAGVYSAVLHYLKAVDKAGGASDGKAVVAAMKALPTDDPLFRKCSIREDRAKLHTLDLFQAKA